MKQDGVRGAGRWIVLAAGAAAVLLAIVALVALREEGAGPDAAAQRDPVEPERAADPPRETTPPIREAGREKLEPPPDPELSPPPDPEIPRAWASVFLTGVVRSRSSPAELVTLLVRPGPNDRRLRGALAARAAWGKPSTDGSFRIDVTAAFPEGAEDVPKKLTVQALRDGVLPSEQEVDVPFDRAAVERGGTLEIPATLVLRESCKLEGSAWAADDPGAAVEVAAFAIVDGVPKGSPAAVATSTPETGFELVVDCDTDLALLAYLDGYRPTTRVVRAGESARLELVLERGATIRGRAELGGRALEGTVLAQDAAAAAGEPLLRNVNGTSFLWTGERFEWFTISSRTRGDGNFELAGLATGEYDVRLAAVAGVYAKDPARRSVAAPAEGLVLAPQVCEIELEYTIEGARAPHALLSVHEALPDGRIRKGSLRTDADGRARLWLDPGSNAKVTAAREHWLGPCSTAGSTRAVLIAE